MIYIKGDNSSAYGKFEVFLMSPIKNTGNSSSITQKYYYPRQIKYPVDFDGELKIEDVRYDNMTIK